MQTLLNSKKLKEGEINIRAKIEVRGGPIYIVNFKANITAPELTYSQPEINFGEVLVGHRKTVTIRLENRKKVECKYNFNINNDLLMSSKEKKELCPIFTMTPFNERLAPGSQINVKVSFAPAKKKTYELKITPSITTTKRKPAAFKLVGEGVEVSMSLNVQNEILLGPQLPYTLPEKYSSFKLLNESSFPIEAYAVEFDKYFMDEEKMLNSYSGISKEAYCKSTCSTCRRRILAFYCQRLRTDSKSQPNRMQE